VPLRWPRRHQVVPVGGKRSHGCRRREKLQASAAGSRHADEASTGMEVVDFYVSKEQVCSDDFVSEQNNVLLYGPNSFNLHAYFESSATAHGKEVVSSFFPQSACIGIKMINFSTWIKGIQISLDNICLSINILSSSVIY
jgi:hypothetical protein